MSMKRAKQKTAGKEKDAETDATKRALATFGNLFGLVGGVG